MRPRHTGVYRVRQAQKDPTADANRDFGCEDRI